MPRTALKILQSLYKRGDTVPLTRKNRHAIRNKLQLIVSCTELRRPKDVIHAVREIDRMLG